MHTIASLVVGHVREACACVRRALDGAAVGWAKELVVLHLTADPDHVWASLRRGDRHVVRALLAAEVVRGVAWTLRVGAREVEPAWVALPIGQLIRLDARVIHAE